MVILVVLLKTGQHYRSLIADRMNAIWRISMRGDTDRAAADDRIRLAILRRIFRSGRASWAVVWAPLSAITFGVAILSLFRATAHFADLEQPWKDRLADFKNFWGAHHSITEYGEMPVSGVLAIFFLILALPENWIYLLRRHWLYRGSLQFLKFRLAPAFFALLFLYIALAFGNHLIFMMEDAAGLVCKNSNEDPETKFGNRDQLRYCSAPEIGMCDQNGQPSCSNFRVKPKCLDGQRSPGPSCDVTLATKNVAMCGNVPAICEKQCADDVIEIPKHGDDAPKFETHHICFATGVFFDKYGTYRIAIIPENKERWDVFNGTIETVAGGSYVNDPSLETSQKLKMLLFWPLKRVLLQPWSTVVVRVGSSGNNEEEFLGADDSEEPLHNRKNLQRQEKFKPKRDGELFVYINDVGIAGGSTFRAISNFINSKLKAANYTTAIPPIDWSDRFYRHNKGKATIRIERLLN